MVILNIVPTQIFPPEIRQILLQAETDKELLRKAMRKDTYSKKDIYFLRKLKRKGCLALPTTVVNTLKFLFIYEGEICDPSRTQSGTNWMTALPPSSSPLKCHSGFPMFYLIPGISEQAKQEFKLVIH